MELLESKNILNKVMGKIVKEILFLKILCSPIWSQKRRVQGGEGSQFFPLEKIAALPFLLT